MEEEDKRIEKAVEKLAREESSHSSKMEEQVIVNKTEKPNSFETGKAGSRWKLYFKDADDLRIQIEKLKEAGFEINQKEEK